MPRVAPSNKKERIDCNGWLKYDNSLKGAWSFRTKEKIQCLCEGGTRCSKEAPEAQKGGNAIPGLHSNWVGKDASMLAMARPWHQYVLKYRLVDAFVSHNIGMVLNLQEVGEHDHCGPGNLRKSGFSYDPELFMAAKIGFFNFSWQDMGVPDLDRMMDIVQVMDYTVVIEKRKVAVHCHAGLGRTGLAIACYFLYQNRTSESCCSKQIIQIVRNGRPGALQTRTQELFVSIFQQYLLHLSCLFGGVEGPPKGLQSLHSSTNLVAMSTPQQALSQAPQQDVQQQAPPQARQIPSGSSSFSMMGFLGRKSSPPKPVAMQATQKPQEGGGSLDSTSTGSFSLFGSSPAGSSNSLPSNPGSTKDGHGTAGTTATKVFEHGLKIIGPSNPRGEGKIEGGHRAASPELTSASRQQGRQEQKPQKHHAPPWDDKKCIHLSKYSTSWVPQPPHTYAEALRRQQRLLHGCHRRSYNHLHRFLKKAVFAIIAVAQESRAAASHGLAGAVLDAAPYNDHPQQIHTRATAYVPQPLIYHHITRSQLHQHAQNHHRQQQLQQQQQQSGQQQQPQQAHLPPKPQPLQAQSAPPTAISYTPSSLRPIMNPPSLPNSPPPPSAFNMPTLKRGGSSSNFNLTPIEWTPDLLPARETPSDGASKLQEQLLAQEVLRMSPSTRPRKLPPQRPMKRPSTTHSSPHQSSSELQGLSEEALASLPQPQPEDLFGTPPSPHQHLKSKGLLPLQQQPAQQTQARPRLKSSPGQLQLPSQISTPPVPATLPDAPPTISVLPTPNPPSQQAPHSPTPKQPPQHGVRSGEATYQHTTHEPPTTAPQPSSPRAKASPPQPSQPPRAPTHSAGPFAARSFSPTPPPGQAPPAALTRRRSITANGPPSSTSASNLATATRSSTLPSPLTSPPPSALAKRGDKAPSPPQSTPSEASPRTSTWAPTTSSDNLPPSHTLRPPLATPPPPSALTKRTAPNPSTAPPNSNHLQQQQQQQQRSSGPVAEGAEALDLVGHNQQQHPQQQQQQQQQGCLSGPKAEGVEMWAFAAHARHQQQQHQHQQHQQHNHPGSQQGAEEEPEAHRQQLHTHASGPSQVTPATSCSPLWRRLFGRANVGTATQQASLPGFPSQHAPPRPLQQHKHSLKHSQGHRQGQIQNQGHRQGQGQGQGHGHSRGPVGEGCGLQSQGNPGLGHAQGSATCSSRLSSQGRVGEDLELQSQGLPGLGHAQGSDLSHSSSVNRSFVFEDLGQRHGGRAMPGLAQAPSISLPNSVGCGYGCEDLGQRHGGRAIPGLAQAPGISLPNSVGCGYGCEDLGQQHLGQPGLGHAQASTTSHSRLSSCGCVSEDSELHRQWQPGLEHTGTLGVSHSSSVGHEFVCEDVEQQHLGRARLRPAQAQSINRMGDRGRSPACEGLDYTRLGNAHIKGTSPMGGSGRGPVCEGLDYAGSGNLQGLGVYFQVPPQQQQQEHLQPCQSFTQAVALCTHRRRLEQQGVNVVASLARSRAYCYPFLGKENTEVKGERSNGADSMRGGPRRVSVSWDEGEGLAAHLEHELLRLKRRANHEDFELTNKAPVLLLVHALHDFFQQFHDAGPSLSLTTLEHAMKHYKTLPYEADPTTPEAQQLQAASLALSPIPVCDQELLLLFVALMRNCELAGGASTGDEEEPESHSVAIGRWVLHLLMGPNISAEVEEAMLSLLWYYLRNDFAYSALVLAKKKRLDKLVHGGRPLVDHPAEDPVLAKYHHERPPPPPRSHTTPHHTHQPQDKGDAAVQANLHQPQYELPQGQHLSTLLESPRGQEDYEPELVSDMGIPLAGPMIADAPDQSAALSFGPLLPQIHDAWK